MTHFVFECFPVGFSIIFTLAGTSFYGAGSGAVKLLDSGSGLTNTHKVSSLKRLDVIGAKQNHPNKSGKLEGKVGGDIEAVDLEEEGSGDGYVRIRNHDKDEEEAEAEEEEKEELVSA